MYIYIYINIYIFIHISIYTYIYTYLYICVYIHIYVCMYMYINIRVCAYVRVYVYAHSHTLTWTHIHTHTHTHAYEHIHVNICIYVHTHIHKYNVHTDKLFSPHRESTRCERKRLRTHVHATHSGITEDLNDPPFSEFVRRENVIPRVREKSLSFSDFVRVECACHPFRDHWGSEWSWEERMSFSEFVRRDCHSHSSWEETVILRVRESRMCTPPIQGSLRIWMICHSQSSWEERMSFPEFVRRDCHSQNSLRT